MLEAGVVGAEKEVVVACLRRSTGVRLVRGTDSRRLELTSTRALELGSLARPEDARHDRSLS